MKFHRLWGEGGREQDTSREASGDPRLQSFSSFPLNCPHVLCCTVTHYQLTYLYLFWTLPTWKDLLEMKRSSLARHIWRRSLRRSVPPIFFIILPPQPESWSNTCPFIIWPCNQCLVAGHCFWIVVHQDLWGWDEALYAEQRLSSAAFLQRLLWSGNSFHLLERAVHECLASLQLSTVLRKKVAKVDFHLRSTFERVVHALYILQVCSGQEKAAKSDFHLV